MRFSLMDVYQQAVDDSFAVNLKGKGYNSISLYGVKIVMDYETKEVALYNMNRGGLYYDKLSEDETNNFLENGWRYGVYVISLSNYRTKLDRLELKIRDEVNNRNRVKEVQAMRDLRDIILRKYSEITNKLNQLN